MQLYPYIVYIYTCGLNKSIFSQPNYMFQWAQLVHRDVHIEMCMDQFTPGCPTLSASLLGCHVFPSHKGRAAGITAPPPCLSGSCWSRRWRREVRAHAWFGRSNKEGKSCTLWGEPAKVGGGRECIAPGVLYLCLRTTCMKQFIPISTQQETMTENNGKLDQPDKHEVDLEGKSKKTH